MNSQAQTVAVLPLMTDEPTSNLEDFLHSSLTEMNVVRMGLVGSELDAQQWIAVVCKRISESGQAFQGVHLIAFGEAVDRLPDIAFAQRASRRIIHSYTLIDFIPEKHFAEWPDAPVSVIITNPLSPIQQSAKLRGWEVQIIEPVDLPVALAKTLQNFTI